MIFQDTGTGSLFVDVCLHGTLLCIIICMLLAARPEIQTHCCGQNVSQVIGIEMCKEAVEDAKVNADLNGE